MSSARLTIDLAAIAANWRALDGLTDGAVETGAVVKADAYGLGAAPVARALRDIGVNHFFVALAQEGAALRKALGAGPSIAVFSGHMAGDSALIGEHALTPMLNSPEQISRHFAELPGHDFGIQLDTGMNRLGIEPGDWQDTKAEVLAAKPTLIMSHLACADEPDHMMNTRQLSVFKVLTDGLPVRRSLAATGGILLGPAYHFDLTRPGIGLYGGAPFLHAAAVARLSLPVIQTRDLSPGETVGYGNSWTADRPVRLATVAAGYADGLLRALSNRATLWHGETPCPLVGRVSMDLITADISQLDADPDSLDILTARQGVDALAEAAGTIGYEILTSLGPRYERHYEAAS